MERNRNVERQLVMLRWLVIAAAALMMVGAVAWQKIAVGVAVAVAFNGALALTGRVPRAAGVNQKLTAFAWVFDIVFLSAAVGVSLPGAGARHKQVSLFFIRPRVEENHQF